MSSSVSPAHRLRLPREAELRLPSTEQNAALVGTAGTPGTTNKFVTDVDPRFTTLQAQIDAIESAGGWNHTQAFDLVDAQADYLFAVGGAADTTASHALVQWGSTVLVPDTDYVILADRLRLINSPSAQDVALGQPLVARVSRVT